MPEEEKKINELLNKIENFATSLTLLPFQQKPQYVSVVERELEKPTLKNGEYIKVQFNPVTEVVSSLVTYYFLVKDGILKTHLKTTVEQFNFSNKYLNYFTNIVRVYGEFADEDLFIIDIKKPYVFVVRDNSNEIDHLSAEVYDALLNAIEDTLGIHHLPFVLMVDGTGLFFFYGDIPSYYSEGTTRLALSLLTSPHP